MGSRAELKDAAAITLNSQFRVEFKGFKPVMRSHPAKPCAPLDYRLYVFTTPALALIAPAGHLLAAHFKRQVTAQANTSAFSILVNPRP